MTGRSRPEGQQEKGMLWFADERVGAGPAPGGEDPTPSSILLWCLQCHFGCSCLRVLPGEGEHKLNPCPGDVFQVLEHCWQGGYLLG